jgi:hypothetical protein
MPSKFGLPRLRPSAILALLPLALAACPGLPFALLAPSGSHSPSIETSATELPRPTPILGGVIVDETPRPTPSAATASGAVEPTPTTTTTPPGPFIIDMAIEPASTRIGMRPPQGATPFAAYTTQLQAKVTLSNGLKVSSASWKSLDTSVADVDSTGFVTAGAKPGETIIVATSTDGMASASARVIVSGDAGLGVLLE